MLGAALLVVAAVAVLLWRAVEEPVNALAMPEGRPTPRVFEEEQYEAAKELARIRLGSFERPEDVPGYQVLEKTPTESLGTRSAQLVVGTHSRGREAFTLITRDLMARYAGYDVIRVYKPYTRRSSVSY
jgi:hypothetical protein